MGTPGCVHIRHADLVLQKKCADVNWFNRPDVIKRFAVLRVQPLKMFKHAEGNPPQAIECIVLVESFPVCLLAQAPALIQIKMNGCDKGVCAELACGSVDAPDVRMRGRPGSLSTGASSAVSSRLPPCVPPGSPLV